MSKQCAKCTKTVYPTEELKCLDKVRALSKQIMASALQAKIASVSVAQR